MIKFFNGIPINVPNTITKNSEEEKYYISYNPYESHYGGATTALVITIGNNERQVFYILKGNHSEQYENCKDLKECVNYFVSNNHLAEFSDPFEHEYLT